MTAIGEINSVENLLKGTPNHGVYRGDFAEKSKSIFPTDLDGIVEIKGCFLIHEYKFENSPLTDPQERMQKELLPQGFTIINIWHKGPCINMDLIRAEVFIPDYLVESGLKHWEINEDVLKSIKRFHQWWTHKVLALQR